MGDNTDISLPALKHQHSDGAPQYLVHNFVPTQREGECDSVDCVPCEGMQYQIKPSRIYHAVADLILNLELFTEDPYGVRDKVNIFLFPCLSL